MRELCHFMGRLGYYMRTGLLHGRTALLHERTGLFY
jgi:hypothetical protein